MLVSLRKSSAATAKCENARSRENAFKCVQNKYVQANGVSGGENNALGQHVKTVYCDGLPTKEVDEKQEKAKVSVVKVKRVAPRSKPNVAARANAH